MPDPAESVKATQHLQSFKIKPATSGRGLAELWAPRFPLPSIRQGQPRASPLLTFSHFSSAHAGPDNTPNAILRQGGKPPACILVSCKPAVATSAILPLLSSINCAKESSLYLTAMVLKVISCNCVPADSVQHWRCVDQRCIVGAGGAPTVPCRNPLRIWLEMSAMLPGECGRNTVEFLRAHIIQQDQ